MSLDATIEGRPVHFPQNPDRFSFDGEVSQIFPDMAKRAIPNFYEAHAAHARMLKSWLFGGASILDVGASRGAFFEALYRECPMEMSTGNIRLSAVDNSWDMCKLLSADFPEAAVLHEDISDPKFLFGGRQYDVVCVHYVLQFVEPAHQPEVLRKLINAVKPGGVFIYGHKGRHSGAIGELTHDEYIRFRVNNGYSCEEIAAKTKALKASMFPLDHDVLMDVLRKNFLDVVETFRFMMFSTVFAVK